MLKIGLTQDELVIIARHRKCEIGGTVTISEQRFQMCLSGSNSVYMHSSTPQLSGLTLTKIDLTSDELVLVADHRRCKVGDTITIGKQKFQKCLSRSNSVYMSEMTLQPEPQLAA